MTDTDSQSEGGMQVDAGLVRQLAELLNENDLTEIEVEDGDRRIVVKRQPAAVAVAPLVAPFASPASSAAPADAPAPPLVETISPADHPGTVKAPMVGTVYLSGEPGAAPFVSPGDKINVGDTLVVVEAMKVMNAITAPKAGTVAQVLVQNGQPVEFGQPLVIVE